MNYKVLFETSCSELEKEMVEVDSKIRGQITFGDVLYIVFSSIKKDTCFSIEDISSVGYKEAYEAVSRAVIKERELNEKFK
jgi:hypothetical protein